jgi:predicted amidohydrolase YtcJ
VEYALEEEIAHAHSLGVTGVHDTCSLDGLRAFETLRDSGRLNIRVRANLSTPDSRSARAAGLVACNDLLALGAIKVIADGSIGARNAAFSLPYVDDDTTSGRVNHSREQLAAIVRDARETSTQVEVHAIGDAAIGTVLDAFVEAGVTPDDRSRIEHCELPNDADLDRMRRLGVVASMQPNFLQWSGPRGLYERRLGRDRDALIDPHRRVVDAGVRLAFGSDHMPLGPLLGIHHAVNAPHAGQLLSVVEALRAYTHGGAYAGFDEADSGRLQSGYRADLIVLDANPVDHGKEIDRILVDRTYVGGRLVYERPVAGCG